MCGNAGRAGAKVPDRRARNLNSKSRTDLVMRLTTLIATCLIALAAAFPAAAQQGLFAPKLIINNRAITQYEYEQRALFLKTLRIPGNPEEMALQGLTEDRLRMNAAEALGLRASEEQMTAGMEEFAARAKLSTEEFIKAIGEAGVEPQTYRDFIEAGIVWREVVRARFGPRAQVTDTEIDRAMALSSQRGGVRVLLSELVIPAPPGSEDDAMAQAIEIQNTIRNEADFSTAARTYSATPSAANGGRLDWMPLSNLPPSIAPIVLVLAPGEVSDPVSIGPAVALFQLRAIADTDQPQAETVAIDFAQFFLPNDDKATAEAARIRAEVDGCDDLYGIALGLPEDRLLRDTLPMAQIPADVALELAKLDEGESSTALTRGGNRVFLMLCGRTLQIEDGPSREDVRQRLINQRLAAYADGYLEELRADAIIREP